MGKQCACKKAAENGHFYCLKYAWEQGCELSQCVLESAITSGNLNCVQFYFGHGKIDCTTYLHDLAALGQIQTVYVMYIPKVSAIMFQF